MRDQPVTETSTWQRTILTRQTNLPPTGFEPAIPSSERPPDLRLRPRGHQDWRFEVLPEHLLAGVEDSNGISRGGWSNGAPSENVTSLGEEEVDVECVVMCNRSDSHTQVRTCLHICVANVNRQPLAGGIQNNTLKTVTPAVCAGITCLLSLYVMRCAFFQV
jgi:hypothetical protein